MTRVNAGQVIEEGVNGCQPRVPSRHAVFAHAFQVVQEVAKGIGGQVFQTQGGRGLSMPATNKLQKKLQRIAVGHHGVTAEAALGHEVLLEEPTNNRCDLKLGHALSFWSTAERRSESESVGPPAPTTLLWREDKLRCRRWCCAPNTLRAVEAW